MNSHQRRKSTRYKYYVVSPGSEVTVVQPIVDVLGTPWPPGVVTVVQHETNSQRCCVRFSTPLSNGRDTAWVVLHKLQLPKLSHSAKQIRDGLWALRPYPYER